MMPLEPRRILAITVSRIGDTLLTTPAIRAMAQRWPQAEIDCCGHPNRVEVLEHLPFVRHVGPISKKSAPWRGWMARCTQPQYDLALVWGYDEALVAYALRVSRHVVAHRQRDPRLNARLYRAVDTPPFQSAHAVHLNLALTDALDTPHAGLRLSYCMTDAEAAWAQQRLRQDIPLDVGPLIGLQVASFPTKAYRDWPVAHFIELCAQIRAQWPQAHFLIFGGSEEKDKTAAMMANLGGAATLYAGQLSLRQTAALMSGLDAYIGVDTGPTHLMSTFDIPLIALYHGYSRSELIAPLEHPCLYAIDHPRAGPTCTPEAPMAEITVERVWQAVRRALGA